MKTNLVEIGRDIQLGDGKPAVLVAGPCVIESKDHLLRVCEQIKQSAMAVQIPYVLKTSFDKANRSSVDAYRGPGLQEGLRILDEAKRTLEVPVLTDVHDISQVEAVAEVADVIQIPAFLCRQTDLLIQAARTHKPINIKKGQFLAPDDVRNAIGKIENAGNQQIIITERGVTFGYHNLVVDMRAFPIMRAFGYPVMFDATHSLQLPGGQGTSTGGQSQFIPHLLRAATACGLDAVFMEVHDNPQVAPCDGSNMLPLADLPGVLEQIREIDGLVKDKQWIF